MGARYGIRAPGYRLPDATHVGRVRLQVSDLTRSVDYYQDVIGLQVLHRDGPSAALAATRGDTALVELYERPGARPVPPDGRFGLYHFALLVPDRGALGRFALHLVEHGVRFSSADHLVSEALYLWDPDGLGIEVYVDRPRSEWRARGRELVMVTEPLDLKGLLSAAQGSPWNGLPAQTVMGHVHLHVGSLQRAEALYHSALGFDKMVWSFPGALFLSAGDYHHHLAVNTWVQGASPAGDEDARLLEWELVVPSATDREDATDSLTRSGYEVLRDGDGCLVSDDWGTRFRLTARS